MAKVFADFEQDGVRYLFANERLEVDQQGKKWMVADMTLFWDEKSDESDTPVIVSGSE